MLSGDNSILSRAGEARDITGEKETAEKVQLAYIAALANGQGQVTEQLLKDELDKAFGESGYELSEDLTKVTIDEKEYDVGGTVSEGSGLTKQADGTYKDSKGNEWVWIEVPKSVTASVTEDNDIYDALRDYCNDVIAKTGTDYKTTTNGYTDTWYSGCGLEQDEYNTAKSKMLNSIKANGGFYIGKYETGNEGGTLNKTYYDGDDNVVANPESGYDYYVGTWNGGTAVIKQNAFPYNWVTCSQAQNLAKGFATDGKQASLLFGIQWDLVLKFIKVKESLSDNTILTADSKDWGNYYNTTYNIANTNAWYSTDYGANWTKGAYNKTSNGATLLTTGADSKFAKQNIYDLAGNVDEWTLEKTSDDDVPCAFRGGLCDNLGGDDPASCRNIGSTTDSVYDIGFRVTLY